MLKLLRLQNIILVEQADIPFHMGLNILTGETGAGKSAIMKGLELALGERCDTGIIRKGCERAIVEASFEIDKFPSLLQILDESGLEHDHGQDLLIRREISSSGKNRLFINNQLAQLNLLRKIGQHLAHVVGQHANQQLFSLEYHREVLDLFGIIKSYSHVFQESFKNEITLKTQLENLIHQTSQRIREIDMCQKELMELEEAQLKKGEDEELFAEYSLMVNAKELTEKIQEINQGLTGNRQPIIPLLNRHKTLLNELTMIDPNFLEISQHFQNIFLEIQELSRTLLKYQDSIQNDPCKLEQINDRLTLINKLKRKYGNEIEDIHRYYEETKKKLNQLENTDSSIEDLKLQLEIAQKNTEACAKELTLKRKHYAKLLEESVTGQLHSLNMAKAQFIVNITPQKRTLVGDERVEFFLQPNVGEHQIPLKDAASGGEVSRVLLALQTLLAGKSNTATLIFDEVDANIGGETAAIVGEKLQEIGQQHQVICVTHFSQVARQAHHHLKISKKEKDGRTVTEVQRLDTKGQEKELQRMRGEGNILES